MSVHSLLKKKQNRLLSKTWRTALTTREIAKNTYHITGNLQKACEFAYQVARYEFPKETTAVQTQEPMVIFSLNDMLSQTSSSLKETGGAQALM